MQTPTEEVLVFDGRVAAELTSPRFVTASGAHRLADLQRQTIDDEPSSFEDFAYQDDYPKEPTAQSVQKPIEVGDTQAADMAQSDQQAQSVLVMILEIFSRYNRHRQVSAANPIV